MKKRLSGLILCAALAAGTLSACGAGEVSSADSTAESTSSQTTTTTAATTAATSEDASSAPELSGKVVVYCPSPAGLADNIAAAFTEKTGVEVEIFQGTTGEILARLEAEKENPVADVAIMASWADGLNMIADDQVLSYTAQNAENAYWVDDANMIYGYSASAMAVIYNTTLFPTLAADWDELGSNAEYKDQIAIPDPTKSGSCKDFLSGFVNVMGDDGQAIIDSWVANGVTVPGANKAALEAVTTGEKGILIAGVDYNGYDSIASGEPLGIYYPESGTVINPRPAMILKTSQNLDNAKAFMDFLLSDEAQQLICEAYLLPGIKGITTDKRANMDEIKELDVDWSWMGEHSEEITNNLMGSVN